MVNEPYLAKIEDVDSLKEMYHDFYRETNNIRGKLPNETRISINSHLESIWDSNNDWVYLVDEPAGSPAGFIMCHRYNNAADKHIKLGDVEIESFVARAGRGRGLGKLLKNTAIDSVAKRATGSARVLSTVEKGNAANIRILKKTGFKSLRGTSYSANDGQTYSVYAREII